MSGPVHPWPPADSGRGRQAARPVVVIKFGGTSLQTADRLKRAKKR